MTDEELLEIIDFNYRRDYSLTLDPEVAELNAQREEEQNQIQEQVQESGGITEADAVAIAQKWMDSFFHVSTDGMEETIYLTEEYFDVPIYHITYSIRSNCYYYFSISTIDGTVMSIDVSLATWSELPEISETEANAQISTDSQAALQFMKEKLEIADDFESIHCLYRAEDGQLLSRLLSYYFTTAEGKIHLVTFCRGTGEFSGYSQVSPELYQQRVNREDVTDITVYPEN